MQIIQNWGRWVGEFEIFCHSTGLLMVSAEFSHILENGKNKWICPLGFGLPRHGKSLNSMINALKNEKITFNAGNCHLQKVLDGATTDWRDIMC